MLSDVDLEQGVVQSAIILPVAKKAVLLLYTLQMGTATLRAIQ
jgi:hypothetical protein